MRVGYWTYSSQMHQKKSHSIHKEKLWLNWWHCSTALHELITEIRKEDWQFTIFFKQLVQLDIWTICLWILKICQRLWLWNLEILIVFLLWLYAVYRYYIYVHVQAIPYKVHWLYDYSRHVDIRMACVLDRPCCSESLNVGFSKTAEKIAESMKM